MPEGSCSAVAGLGEMIVCDRYEIPVKQPEKACARRYRMLRVLQNDPDRVQKGGAATGDQPSSMMHRLMVCNECPHAEARLAKFDLARIDKELNLREDGRVSGSRLGGINKGKKTGSRIKALVLAALEEHGPMTITTIVKKWEGSPGSMRSARHALNSLVVSGQVKCVTHEKLRVWLIAGDERPLPSGRLLTRPDTSIPGMWKPIAGSGERYYISRLGEVWSAHAGRVMTYKMKYGFGFMLLNMNERTESHSVHSLVWNAFVGSTPGPGQEIGHKNGCRSDNRLENLEIGPKSKYRERVRLTAEDVRKMRKEWAAGAGISQIAKARGVDFRTIHAAVSGKTWKDVG